MKKYTLITCLIFYAYNMAAQGTGRNVVADYTIPAKEVNAFRHFNHNQSPGRNKVNTYLLAKLSQMMYTERLDFELRKLKNPGGFPSSSFRSSQLNTTSNRTFEADFARRFSHWFYDLNAKPAPPVKINIGQPVIQPGTSKINSGDLTVKRDVQLTNNSLSGSKPAETKPAQPAGPTAEEKYRADSIAFEKSKPMFRFLNKREDFVSISFATNEVRIPGFDPEVMLVSTEDYIIVAWRGTDNVYGEDIWEWIGSDFYFIPVSADGPLAGAKVHAGMWASFKVIRTKLMNALNAFEAKTKNKKVFVTGHSLGGGMALVSAPYLQGSGYNVAGVYAFAAPRTIGDQAYVNKCNSLLGRQKIQRFEYGVDPITKMWSPALYASSFKIPGVRNWYSAEAHESSDEFYDCAERYFPMTLNPAEYMGYSRQKIDRENGDFGLTDPISFAHHLATAVSGNGNRPQDIRQFPMIDFGHHNPTFYTRKAYDVLSASDKDKLPSPADTFPYVLPGVRGNK